MQSKTLDKPANNSLKTPPESTIFFHFSIITYRQCRTKKRINRNKFTLVNMGAETNVVCTLKKEAEDSEETEETGKSDNKVGT